MNTYCEPSKQIPVYGTYDVIVVGGGCAGFTAAVAAARNGARTLILEQFPFFGGTATASLMATIVGTRNQVQPDDLQVCKGLGEELILRMIEQHGAAHSTNAYKSEKRSDTKGDLSYSYAFDTEVFKKVSLEMVLQSGCEILFHTYFADTIVEDGRVTGVLFENKSGRQAAFAKVVVDASGDGDVAARGGADFWQTKGEEAKRLNDGLMYKITGFEPGTKQAGCVFGDSMALWGPAPGAHNGADARELTDMEINTRLKVFDHLEELKKKNPELKDARVSETGVLLGIRQTRFIKGVYTLTGEDVLQGAAFEDAVAMGANPVIQYYGYRRFLDHEGYEIPYRCLVPEKLDGLLVAGRCMSSDQIAYESWRAMAHVLNIGEAAGTAAALCARDGVQPRAVDIKALRQTLMEQGAEIGQGRTKPAAVYKTIAG